MSQASPAPPATPVRVRRWRRRLGLLVGMPLIAWAVQSCLAPPLPSEGEAAITALGEAPAVASSPASAPATSAATSSQTEATPEPHQVAGLPRQAWAQLLTGAPLQRQAKLADGGVRLESWFLVEAPLAAIRPLFIEPELITQVYAAVETVEVLRADEGGARVLYKSRYGPLRVNWVCEERWNPRELSWQLATDAPEASGHITRATGGWRFVDTGDGRTVLCFRNDFALAWVPDRWVARFMREEVPTVIANVRRLAQRER